MSTTHGPGDHGDGERPHVVPSGERHGPAPALPGRPVAALPPHPSEGDEVRATARAPDTASPDRPADDASHGRAEPPDTDRLRAELEERTADLQRVKAEYDNFRKRTRRDRVAVREIAVANVLRGLLPVLDAVEQAREHGEVRGGFATVADALESQLAALGLRSFGEPGEPFDPALHEALAQRPSPAAERAVCAEVLRPGYRVGDHLLRPATVTVAAPG